MKKTINKSHIEGYFYSHELEERVTGETSKNPGTNYIKGKVNIAVDEECTNVITVHFTYVTPTTAKGNVNQTYTTLQNMINGSYPSVMSSSKETAAKLRVDSAVGILDIYDARNKKDFTFPKVNNGGFVHIMTEAFNEDENKRAIFETDIVITRCVRKEADEEKELPERMIVKGEIFDFKQSIMPVEYTVLNPKAMDYFESLEATDKAPVFTKVWGKQVSKVVIRKTEEENAWGEIEVREVKTSQKDFIITGASREPYPWDSEESILASEMTEKAAEREVHLADVKSRAIKALEENGTSVPNVATAATSTTTATPNSEYKF